MRRFIAAVLIAAGSAGFLAVTISDADAQSRKKNKNARELTVRGRAFTDSGKHPLPGSQHRYVEQFTHTNQPAYSYQGRYGQSLPGQFGAFQPR